MGPLSFRIPYYTHAADDVRGVSAVDCVANAIRTPPFYLKTHYTSPLGTHFRDLAWKAGSDKQTETDGTCELIIFHVSGDFKQLGVLILSQ
jgi:hypothetical protein